MDAKRQMNKFTWISPENRPSKFGGTPPPRKHETREPLYYLDYSVVDNGVEVYFVNHSDEVLTSVSCDTAGFDTDDEDLILLNGPSAVYESVLAGEAVKIDHFDWLADSDAILQFTITIESNRHGRLQLRCTGKPGTKAEVLMWNTGETGNATDQLK